MGDFRSKTLRVLRKLGISLCEHFIMGTVGYRIPLRPEEIPDQAGALFEGDPRGSFPQPAFRKAAEQCLQKGWLEIITPEQIEAAGQLVRQSDLPRLFEIWFEPGVVDFSPAGYSIYRQSLLGIFGKRHVQFDDSGWRVDETNCRIDILAETVGWCRKRMTEVLLDPSLWVGRSVKIIRVTGPVRVEAWAPNRFTVLPRGFQATMGYEILAGPD